MQIIKTEETKERKKVPAYTGQVAKLITRDSRIFGTLHSIEGTNRFVLITVDGTEVHPIQLGLNITLSYQLLDESGNAFDYHNGRLITLGEETTVTTTKQVDIVVGDKITMAKKRSDQEVVGTVVAVDAMHLVIADGPDWYLFNCGNARSQANLESECSFMYIPGKLTANT